MQKERDRERERERETVSIFLITSDKRLQIITFPWNRLEKNLGTLHACLK